MMKINRTCSIQRIIYNFKRLLLQNKMILIKSFFTGDLYDLFKLIHGNLNQGNKFHECYSTLKLITIV